MTTEEEHDEREEHVVDNDDYKEAADSKMSQLDDLLNEKLEKALHKSTLQVVVHDLAKIASEHDPIDLAYAVTRLPVSTRPVIYENLPSLGAKISFMISAGQRTRIAVFREIDDEEIKELVEGMPPDEAVAVLEDLSIRRRRRLFELLDPKRARQIKELQKHEPHTAGRLMSNDFFAFDMNRTIGEVTSEIRDQPGVDLTRNIFVIGQDKELVGIVPVRTLLINPNHTQLRQIMREVAHSVSPDASRDEIVDVVERYKIPALPVVDDEGHLLGVIAYEDVVEMMEDIADETIASMAGTSEEVGEHDPIIKRFFWRAPWLIVTLCAGLTSATALAHFQGNYWFLAVPPFIPLITGMSGNVGIQSSTLLVRSMAMGELSHKTRWGAARREIVLGAVTGVIFGAACAAIMYFVQTLGFGRIEANSMAVSLTIFSGIVGACLVASSLGGISPIIFSKFDIDPAVASGPLVTAFNDVLSTLMYIWIAYVVGSFFIG